MGRGPCIFVRILWALAVAAFLGCGDSADSGKNASGSLELDGRPFDLWKGREASSATVVIFTRSDCPISNRYAPTVRSLCEAYQEEGVDFFLVYVDPKETSESIRRHREEYQYACPGVRDPLHALVRMCGATVTPEAVVFDSHRKIVYRGRIDDLAASFGESRAEATTHDLADAIEAALAGRPVVASQTEAVGCYIGDLQ